MVLLLYHINFLIFQQVFYNYFDITLLNLHIIFILSFNLNFLLTLFKVIVNHKHFINQYFQVLIFLKKILNLYIINFLILIFIIMLDNLTSHNFNIIFQKLNL